MSTKTYREEKGKQIPGVNLYAYIRNAGYHLTEIAVYQDGMVDCWGLVDFEAFVQKVKERWVVTNLKAGTRIRLPFTAPGELAVLEADTQDEETEFIKEVDDQIQILNGRPTSLQRFKAAIERWQQAPSGETLTETQKAWEAMAKWRWNEHIAFDWLTDDEWEQIYH